MNLILFDPAELGEPLSRTDPRAMHLLDVLRRKIGEAFDAGVINGPRGKGTLVALSPFTLTLTFTWGAAPPPLDPITLLIGLPRPQTARKILQDAATLGVKSLHFFRAEKGEAGYGQSTLWSSGEWRRHLIAGAGQAFDTHLPEITSNRTLVEELDALPPGASRFALDNYEAPHPLSHDQRLDDVRCVLALGPERGWSPPERDLLRASGFRFAHLGSRVLRTETAVVAAVTLLRAALGRL